MRVSKIILRRCNLRLSSLHVLFFMYRSENQGLKKRDSCWYRRWYKFHGHSSFVIFLAWFLNEHHTNDSDENDSLNGVILSDEDEWNDEEVNSLFWKLFVCFVNCVNDL